ncbi:MAG: tetratricopeptide repeat protein [Myxococcales bacterium]|nr:tetratricopeptide repeat protein [Myxococcales bacterium]
MNTLAIALLALMEVCRRPKPNRYMGRKTYWQGWSIWALILLGGCRTPIHHRSIFGDYERKEPVRLLQPKEIAAILEKSPRTYRVVKSSRVMPVSATNVLRVKDPQGPRKLDPFLEVYQVDGRVELRSHLPRGDIKTIFAQASEAFARKRFEEARQLYAEVVHLNPRYFKGYTYLGNSLYSLGRYVDAEKAFRRALYLNPHDYQANMFLGDVLYQLGDYQRSKHALTIAYVLNPQNVVIQERLGNTLAKLSMTLRVHRFMPSVSIEMLSPSGKEVLIRLSPSDGDRWLAFAACMACWEYEEGCKERVEESEDPLRLSMYRECLLSHVASVVARTRSQKEVRVEDQLLLSAVGEGFLEAIVFWEVVASQAPAIILLLPESLRTSIEWYINRYVYMSKRVVTLQPTTVDFEFDSGPGEWLTGR